jgi:WD40 repeat protein
LWFASSIFLEFRSDLMADAFISYSRKDKAFVLRLDEALKSRKREAWVDWDGIRPTEEFMQAIYGAVEAADTFIFVLTPDSVASVVCGREIAHAAAHNKRLVPLVRCDVDAAIVPEALAKLNWIFCRDGDDFEKAVDTLITALETDLEWVHAHTRLLTRAIEWERKGKNSSFLLRGVDLRAAEQWLAQADTDKECQPTALQTKYIIARRKGAATRQRIALGAVSFGLVIAVILAVVALFAQGEAVKQRDVALSRQLAAQAQAMVDQQPKLIGRAGLLAIEAAQIHPSLETDQALRAVLTVLPRADLSLPCKNGVQELAFSPNNDALLVAGGDHVLRWWNLPKHEQQWELPLDGKSQVVGISNDLSQLAIYYDAASLYGDAGLLSIEMLKDRRVVPLKSEKGAPNAPKEVVFSPDGRFCIVRTNHQSWIFETTTGGFVREGKWAAAFDSRGELLGCAEEKDGFKLFVVNTGRVIAMLPGFGMAEPSNADTAESDDDTGLFSTSLSRNGQFVATWNGPRVRVYEVATQQLVGEITSDQEVYDAQVDNRGRFVVVRGERHVQTRIWSLSPSVKEFGRFSDSTAEYVRFSQDGLRLVTVGPSVESVRLWHTIGGEESSTLKTNRNPETFDSAHHDQLAAINPTGEFLAVAGTADEVWLCALEDGRKLATLHHKGVTYVAISQRGDCIVTAGGEDGAKVWPLVRAGGKITGVTDSVVIEQGHIEQDHQLGAMCLSADGSRFMATRGGGYDGVIYVWNIADGKPPRRVTVPDFSIDTICCSADGELVAVNNATPTVRVLSVKDGTPKCSVDHPQHAWYIALSPKPVSRHCGIAGFSWLSTE